MSETNNTKKWSIEQEQYIRFLAAGRTDTTGKRWTNEEYAQKVLKVHPVTLSKWKTNPLFRMAVLEETMGRAVDFLPAMVNAQIKKAIKKEDTAAFMAIMRQAGIVKADKSESEVTHQGEVSFTNQVPIK